MRLVSVIIPCFDAERTLAETIRSAIDQTWRDIEIIVIDDGSIDGSAGIIKGFGNRVRGEFGPNRGASAARNRGTALAKGAFIQYLDADDLLSPEAIERRVAALETSGADVAYADWQRFETNAGEDHMGEIIARSMEEIDADPEIACATQFWAPPAALLYRRAVVDEIGGWNEGLPVIQDARFLFDAARNGARFVRVEDVQAFYRVRPDTLSRRDRRKFALDLYRNGSEIQALWESDGALSQARKTALAGIFDNAARELFHFSAPEFNDAVARYKRISPRRFGYPEMAYVLSRFLGHTVTVGLLATAAQLARPIRKARGTG